MNPVIYFNYSSFQTTFLCSLITPTSCFFNHVHTHHYHMIKFSMRSVESFSNTSNNPPVASLAASVCLECSWVPQHSYHGVLLQYHFGIPFYTLLYTISYILNYFGRTFIKVVSKEKEHSRKKFRNLKLSFLFNTWKNMSGWVENSSLKIVFLQNFKSFTQTSRFLTFTMSF